MLTDSGMTEEQMKALCPDCGEEMGWHNGAFTDRRGIYQPRHSKVYIEGMGFVLHEEVKMWYRQAVGAHPLLGPETTC